MQRHPPSRHLYQTPPNDVPHQHNTLPHHHNTQSPKTPPRAFEYDVARTARLVAYSALVGTPLAALWFGVLDEVRLVGGLGLFRGLGRGRCVWVGVWVTNSALVGTLLAALWFGVLDEVGLVGGHLRGGNVCGC